VGVIDDIVVVWLLLGFVWVRARCFVVCVELFRVGRSCCVLFFGGLGGC